MPTTINAARSNAPSAPRLQVGDLRRIRQGEELPEAPAGTKWQLTGMLETMPPQFEYRLAADLAAPAPTAPTPTAPAPALTVGARQTVANPADLPEVPAGTKWQLTGMIETLPPKFEFELRAAARPAAADFTERYADAWSDHQLDGAEARALYLGLVRSGPNHTADAATTVRRRLIDADALDARSPLSAYLQNRYGL